MPSAPRGAGPSSFGPPPLGQARLRTVASEVVRLVTWNVNSLKARQERVEAWLAECQPDVVCMQETKLADTAFPAMAFSALGYESAHHGEGRWNGVSIISRVGLDDVVAGFGDGHPADDEARLVTATCGGVRVMSAYIPNGRALDHEHYQYKLRWLERLSATSMPSPRRPIRLPCAVTSTSLRPIATCGTPRALVDATHVSAPERAALQRLLDWGLTDVFRDRYPGRRSASSRGGTTGRATSTRGSGCASTSCSDPRPWPSGCAGP